MAEVVEDGVTAVAVGQYGEDAHRAAAGVAHEHVDGEDAFHQRGPIEPSADRPSGISFTSPRSRSGHDCGSPPMVRCEHAMISREVPLRRRHEHAEPTDELGRCEHELAATVA